MAASTTRSRRSDSGPRTARQKRGKTPEQATEKPSGGPRPFWSGTISFGLVSVPVSLHSAVRSNRLPMRMLTSDGTPLQRRYFCPEEERDVPNEETVRGYEVGPDEHVVLTDEELEALAPRASRDIDLRRFVPVREVDPFLFESSYVLAPTGDSAKAYRLLAQVMEAEERAGIATFVLRGKEYLVAILAQRGVLHAQSLRFADEVRTPADAGLPAPKKPPAELVEKVARALKKTPATLAPDDLRDPQAGRLRELVEKKRARGADVVEAREVVPEDSDEAESEDPADLLSVLKRSLAAGGARNRRGARVRQPARKKAPAQRRRARA